MKVKLKPCPFCGFTPLVHKFGDGTTATKIMHNTGCWFVDSTFFTKAMPERNKAWNRRHHTTTTKQYE